MYDMFAIDSSNDLFENHKNGVKLWAEINLN